MKIDIIVARQINGRSHGSAIYLRTVNNDHLISMLFGQPFGELTLNLSEIRAVRLGLMAVKPKYRSEHVVLVTNCNFASRMLERVGKDYKSNPLKNSDDIRKLRAEFETYKRIEFRYIKDFPNVPDYNLCLNLAGSMARSMIRVPGRIQ